jgi:peptidoglycan/xylan/chitin deacetylase (PgdA/CDA1 family)
LPMGLERQSVSPAHGSKPRLRAGLKWVFVHALRYTGLLAFAKWWIRRHGAIVLTFHRILSEKATAQTCSPSGMVVTDATFESLLRHVKERYSILDLANGAPQEQRHSIQVAITFDDGWEDNASTAFPIAAKLNVPFTIFVCPELMEKPVPFWPERIVALLRSAHDSAEAMKCMCQALASNGCPGWAAALADGNGDRANELIERLKSISCEERQSLLGLLLSCGMLSKDCPDGNVDRTMSWSQLARLHRAGVSFGSHSQRHEILTRMPLARVEQEVCESRAALADHLTNCSLFSYPNGDVSPDVRAIVERFGFTLAFINSPGVWSRTSDPLLVPRINLSEENLVDRDGRFSTLAFDYRVFWNAFIHRGLR